MNISHVAASLAKACSEKPNRPFSHFASLDLKNNTILSSDGHRIHSFRLDSIHVTGGGGHERIFIPRADLLALARLTRMETVEKIILDMGDTARYQHGDFGTRYLTDGIYGLKSDAPEFGALIRDASSSADIGPARLGFRKNLDVEVPDFGWVFAHESKAEIRLNRKLLERSLRWCLRHAQMFARWNHGDPDPENIYASLSIRNGCLLVSAGAISGRNIPPTSVLVVPGENTGVNSECGTIVRMRYALDAISCAVSDSITVSAAGASDTYRYILVGIRDTAHGIVAFVVPISTGPVMRSGFWPQREIAAEEVVWK